MRQDDCETQRKIVMRNEINSPRVEYSLAQVMESRRKERSRPVVVTCKSKTEKNGMIVWNL